MTIDLQQQQHAFLLALRNGDEAGARTIVDRIRAAGVEPSRIYFDVFAPSMITIGELWEQNQLSVAEEHLATAITERLIGQLSPWFNLPATHGPERGTVVLGCVQGESHVLGLRMLADLFRKQGWRVLFLGADVPHAEWAQIAQRFNAQVVAISASTGRREAQVRQLIQIVRAAAPSVHVLVGGAAFDVDPQLWQRVGADLYHPDAVTAVSIATAQYAVSSTHPPDRHTPA